MALPFLAGLNLRESDLVSRGVAGETIAVGDALAFVPVAQSIIDLSSSLNYRSGGDFKVFSNASNWFAQSFVVPAGMTKIGNIAIAVRNTGGSGSVTYTFKIRSSLTGSDLYSGASGAYNQDATVPAVTMNANLTVTPGNTYYLLISQNNSDQLVMSSTGAYGTVYESANSGSSWTTGVSGEVRFWFSIDFITTTLTAGRYYKASAADFSQLLNFRGFALTAATVGTTVKFTEFPNVSGVLSGLTAETDYYLSDTPGALSTSAGTFSRWIGRANATTVIDRHTFSRRTVSPPIDIANYFDPVSSQIIMPCEGMLFFLRSSNIQSAAVDGYSYGTANGITAMVQAGATVNVGQASNVLLSIMQ